MFNLTYDSCILLIYYTYASILYPWATYIICIIDHVYMYHIYHRHLHRIHICRTHNMYKYIYIYTHKYAINTYHIIKWLRGGFGRSQNSVFETCVLVCDCYVWCLWKQDESSSVIGCYGPSLPLKLLLYGLQEREQKASQSPPLPLPPLLAFNAPRNTNARHPSPFQEQVFMQRVCIRCGCAGVIVTARQWMLSSRLHGGGPKIEVIQCAMHSETIMGSRPRFKKHIVIMMSAPTSLASVPCTQG